MTPVHVSCPTDPSCLGFALDRILGQQDPWLIPTQSRLKDDRISSGFALLCVSYPTSDCTITTGMEAELCTWLGQATVAQWGAAIPNR